MCLSSRDRRRALAPLCIVLACQGATTSRAQTTVALDATVKAASNPLLQSVPNTNTSAVVFDLSVMPAFKHSDPRGDTIEVAALLTLRQYSRRYPRYLLGSFSATRGFRDSERLSGNVSLGLMRDLAVDTPTVGIDALVSPQSVRTTLSGAGKLEWRPGAQTTISPAISGQWSTYDHTTVLRESRSAQASLGYGDHVSATTTIGVKPLVAFSQTLGQPTLLRYAAYGTIEKRITTIFRLDFELGAEHLPRSNGIGPNTPLRPSATLLAGVLRLCGKTLRFDACGSAELGSQVSALDGFQRSKLVHANLSYRLDERKTLIVQLDYQRLAAAVKLPAQGELQAKAASTELNWRLSSKITLSAMASYIRRQSDAENWPSSTSGGLRLRFEPSRR